jgi:hypothetical protein
MVLPIAVLLTIGTLVFTLLVRAKDVPAPEPVSPTQHLDERKAQIYDNLRDLQFEYRLGKLSDEDYKKTKVGLQGELARVLAEIDAIKSQNPQAVKTAPKPVLQSVPKPEAPDGTTCPHCGATFERALKFCGECGKAMA